MPGWSQGKYILHGIIGISSLILIDALSVLCGIMVLLIQAALHYILIRS